MVQSNRGLPPLEKVCEKHGSSLAYRLRAEYAPGPAPFPDSPEEAAWMRARESLVLTALRSGDHGVVVCSWTRGGEESETRVELDAQGLRALVHALDQTGAWSLEAFGPVRSGEASVELEHESYEEFEHDPDSLDLDSWKPPRRFRIARARAGVPAGAGRELLQAWNAFVPDAARRGPLGSAFAAG